MEGIHSLGYDNRSKNWNATLLTGEEFSGTYTLTCINSAKEFSVKVNIIGCPSDQPVIEKELTDSIMRSLKSAINDKAGYSFDKIYG